MEREPRVSVVMPAYNRASFLHAAIRSVEEQGCDDCELLLIDDGSTDNLRQIASECPSFVRYILQPHRGPSAARNRGVLESKAEFVAFLDVDDLWVRGQLPGLLQALSHNPQAGIAQGLMRQVVVTSDGRSSQTAPYRLPYLGSCLFRRWVFRECGGFDERMPFGEDYDFIFRCWERDVVKLHVEQVSLLYHRHGSNLTQGDNHPAHLLVLKRRLERIKKGLVDPKAERRVVFQQYIGDLGSLVR